MQSFAKKKIKKKEKNKRNKDVVLRIKQSIPKCVFKIDTRLEVMLIDNTMIEKNAMIKIYKELKTQ